MFPNLHNDRKNNETITRQYREPTVMFDRPEN